MGPRRSTYSGYSAQNAHRRRTDPCFKTLATGDHSITGQGYNLVVNTDDAHLAELQAAVTAMDQPPRNLLVTVGYGATGSTLKTSTGTVQTLRSTDASRSSLGQSVRLLEGNSAFIGTSTRVPVISITPHQQRPLRRTHPRRTGCTNRLLRHTPHQRKPSFFTLIEPTRKFSGTPTRNRTRIANRNSLSGTIGEWILVRGVTGSTAVKKKRSWVLLQAFTKIKKMFTFKVELVP